MYYFGNYINTQILDRVCFFVYYLATYSFGGILLSDSNLYCVIR